MADGGVRVSRYDCRGCKQLCDSSEGHSVPPLPALGIDRRGGRLVAVLHRGRHGYDDLCDVLHAPVDGLKVGDGAALEDVWYGVTPRAETGRGTGGAAGSGRHAVLNVVKHVEAVCLVS